MTHKREKKKGKKMGEGTGGEEVGECWYVVNDQSTLKKTKCKHLR